MIHQLGNDLKKKKKKPNQLGLKVTGWSDIPNPSTLAPHNSFWGLSVAEEILPQAGVTVHLQKENWAHRYFNSKKEKKKKEEASLMRPSLWVLPILERAPSLCLWDFH